MDEVDVTEIRKNFIEQLSKRVDEAYNHRVKETYTDKEGLTVETIAEDERFINNISGKGDEEIIEWKYTPIECEVVVENPHDYKDLLEMSIRKFWNDSDFVNLNIEEWLEHESEHYVPLLGHEGVRPIFGVHFFEDSVTGRPSMRPFVAFEGNAPLKLFKDAHTSVTAPSVGDLHLQLK